MAQYSDLVLGQKGTVYNPLAGVAYSTPDQLALDLGTTANKIDWKQIKSDPNYTLPSSNAISLNQLQPEKAIKLPTPTPKPDMTGATIAGATQTSKSLQDYIKELAPVQSETSKTQDSLIKDLLSLAPQATGKQQYQIQQENQAGLPVLQKQLSDTNSLLQTQLAELTQLDTDLQKSLLDTEGKPQQLSSVVGTQQAFLQRQNAALKASKASEANLTATRAAALSGQIQTAQQLATRATELKYQPIIEEIQTKQAQLAAIAPLLNKEENIRAEALNLFYKDKELELQNQKEESNQIQSLAIDAAQNGADAQTVAGIQKASSLEMAINIASPYLQQTKTDIIEMNGRQVLIDTKTGNVIKDLGKAKVASSGGTTQTERLLTQQQSIISNASQQLDSERQTSGDGYANPNTYRKAKQDYIAAGGSTANFFQSFPLEVYISPPNRKGDLLGTSAEIKQAEQGASQSELQSLLERSNDGTDLSKLNLQEKTRLLELLGG